MLQVVTRRGLKALLQTQSGTSGRKNLQNSQRRPGGARGRMPAVRVREANSARKGAQEAATEAFSAPRGSVDHRRESAREALREACQVRGKRCSTSARICAGLKSGLSTAS